MIKAAHSVAIVGFGLEGHSALRYWQDQGAHVTVCDQNPTADVPPGVDRQLGPNYLNGLNRFDVIVRTVGMHPKAILDKNPGVEAKITTNLNEFLRVCPTKNIIGVTGTKGKGTTCMLITKMLEAAGKDVVLAGNFGFPALDFLPKLTSDSWVVLELSSFMLFDIEYSPHIAVCLMVQPEHLDWHGHSDDYYQAKQNLFKWQDKSDTAIYYADNTTSHSIASASPGRKLTYYAQPGAYVSGDKIMIDKTVLCKTSELKLLGKHNWQNVCAAATAIWQIVQVPDIMHKILTTFTGLPHRLEFVREVEGVKYYNDSFGCDPYATEAAIEAIPGHKVLIIGGYERMLPIDHFVQTVKDNHKNIRSIVLIGQSAARVGEAFQKAGVSDFHLSAAKTMAEIVDDARSLAKKGDVVLLSPGFASFDMFKNFEVRGNEFKEVVSQL